MRRRPIARSVPYLYTCISDEAGRKRKLIRQEIGRNHLLLRSNESSFGMLNDHRIEHTLASLVPANLADLSAVNCVPIPTRGSSIQLLHRIESPWVRIRRLHVLWPVVRSSMDHCFMLSTTLSRPGGLVLAPSASWTTIDWSKAICSLSWKGGVLYHSKVSMRSNVDYP